MVEIDDIALDVARDLIKQRSREELRGLLWWARAITRDAMTLNDDKALALAMTRHQGFSLEALGVGLSLDLEEGRPRVGGGNAQVSQ